MELHPFSWSLRDQKEFVLFIFLHLVTSHFFLSEFGGILTELICGNYQKIKLSVKLQEEEDVQLSEKKWKNGRNQDGRERAILITYSYDAHLGSSSLQYLLDCYYVPIRKTDEEIKRTKNVNERIDRETKTLIPLPWYQSNEKWKMKIGKDDCIAADNDCEVPLLCSASSSRIFLFLVRECFFFCNHFLRRNNSFYFPSCLRLLLFSIQILFEGILLFLSGSGKGEEERERERKRKNSIPIELLKPWNHTRQFQSGITCGSTSPTHFWAFISFFFAAFVAFPLLPSFQSFILLSGALFIDVSDSLFYFEGEKELFRGRIRIQ